MIWIYVHGKNGGLMTLKDIARIHNIPYKLVSDRYSRGYRTIEELTQPKFEMLRKSV